MGRGCGVRIGEVVMENQGFPSEVRALLPVSITHERDTTPPCSSSISKQISHVSPNDYLLNRQTLQEIQSVRP